MQNYLLLLAGIACAAIGGELFVQGAVDIARWARVSPGIIAVTVAAFATSSPELSVSISSAVAGTPEIALGDALGSNVVNVALILGIALALSGIRSPRDSIRRDFPVALAVPLVTAVLVADGEISRLEGAALLAGFVGWLIMAIREAWHQRRIAVDEGAPTHRVRTVMAIGAGLALLIAAGTPIVAGARGVAQSYGLPEFVIGATVVAVGTSVPELATTIMAKLRGHDEVSLGTILGSNLFNGLFIVAVAAMIHPIAVARTGVLIALAFGLVAVALTFPGRDGTIGRARGVLLLLLYVAYLAAVLS
ncbi:MAG: K+-dependent Na+/Ca+ exchanger related-protein [Burkholderiaceae bacterium]|jgi:cation:H+ antiporter|nr:K+-dependent Na+/Ca+ exchanger related-protein [Burkholderiaceae bacterium]